MHAPAEGTKSQTVDLATKKSSRIIPLTILRATLQLAVRCDFDLWSSRLRHANRLPEARCLSVMAPPDWKARAEQKRREAADAKARNVARLAELERQESELNRQKLELERQKAELAQQQGGDRTDRLEAETAHLAAVEEQLNDREDQANRKQKDILKAENELKKLEAQREQEEAELTEKQAELIEMQAALTVKQTELDAKQADLAARQTKKEEEGKIPKDEQEILTAEFKGIWAERGEVKREWKVSSRHANLLRSSLISLPESCIRRRRRR